jgi:ribonuclease-3
MPKGSPAQERAPGARAPSRGRGTASTGRGRRPPQKGRKGAPPPGAKKRPAEAVAALPKTQKRPQAGAPTAVSAGRERPIAELAKRLRITVSPEALELAFLHTSYVNERGDTRGSNERLEFLGDAVIDLAVTHYLYAQYPSADEGRLTKAKSVAVSRPMLAEKAEELGLSPYLRLGKGEEANDGRKRVSNLGNAFEALVAVLFLEQGFTSAAKFIMRTLKEDIERFLEEQSTTGDYKSLLQETAQRLFDCRPTYKVSEESGKEHRKEFKVTVSVSGHRAIGRGRSKKEAEQAAAKQLYLMLEEF